MEKLTVGSKRKFFCGLLISAIALFCAAAKAPTASQIRTFTVKPDSNTFFTAQENGYTLYLPEIEPSKVQTDLSMLPPGVQFVSSKQEEYLTEEGKRGTAVHLWFTFKDTGPVRMPPLIVIISNRTFYLPFEDVTVYENPALISPVMEVEFISGAVEGKTVDGVRQISVKSGTEIIFSLKLKYFVQIISFNWKLPKNSIFEEVERYEITRGVAAGTGFSTESMPFVKFSWKPLIEGTYNLPEVTLVATAYNGSRKTIHMPACVIKVSASNSEVKPVFSTEHNAEKLFSGAFTDRPDIEAEDSHLNISVEDCKRMAQLRSKERHSIPFGNAVKERKEFEKSIGLTTTEKEVNKTFVIILIFISLFCFSHFCIFIFAGRIRGGLIFLLTGLVFATFSIFGIVKLIPDYGIFAGGTISSVPETSISTTHSFEGGLRVKISEKAGKFYYIESADMNGWVLKEQVYQIN